MILSARREKKKKARNWVGWELHACTGGRFSSYHELTRDPCTGTPSDPSPSSTDLKHYRPFIGGPTPTAPSEAIRAAPHMHVACHHFGWLRQCLSTTLTSALLLQHSLIRKSPIGDCPLLSFYSSRVSLPSLPHASSRRRQIRAAPGLIRSQHGNKRRTKRKKWDHI